MEIGEYQDSALDTDLQKGNQLYHLLGLLSEVGESFEFITTDNDELNGFLAQCKIVCDKAAEWKRRIRDYGAEYTFFLVTTDESIFSELGKLIYSIACLANDYGADLDVILEQDLRKNGKLF